MGGSFTQFDIWANNGTLVPRATMGVLSTDPAFGLFTVANFPGASTTQLTAARDLYGFLTGRVINISSDARLDSSGTYNYLGRRPPGRAAARVRRLPAGPVAHEVEPDGQRGRPLRHSESRSPPRTAATPTATSRTSAACPAPRSENSCNLFKSGATQPCTPQFQQLKAGSPSHDVDYNNVAPTIGASWVPQARPGFLGALMGDGDFVMRGGYTRSFSRGGLNDFTGFYNANPGVVLTLARSDGNANLGPCRCCSATRRGSRRAAFPSTPTYPMTDVVTQDINGFDPNIQVPYADSWQAGHHAVARQEHGHRGPLRRHARQGRLGHT